MKNPRGIKTLFVDIGGVLLTNGSDQLAREAAAKTFRLDRDAMEERHRLNFETLEVGRLTLDEYLSRVVCDRPRSFTRARFRRFMFAQSQPFPEMLGLVRELKTGHRLKFALFESGATLERSFARKIEGEPEQRQFPPSVFIHQRKSVVGITPYSIAPERLGFGGVPARNFFAAGRPISDDPNPGREENNIKSSN